MEFEQPWQRPGPSEPATSRPVCRAEPTRSFSRRQRVTKRYSTRQRGSRSARRVVEHPDVELSLPAERRRPQVLPPKIAGERSLEVQPLLRRDITLPRSHRRPEQEIAQLDGRRLLRVPRQDVVDWPLPPERLRQRVVADDVGRFF